MLSQRKNLATARQADQAERLARLRTRVEWLQRLDLPSVLLLYGTAVLGMFHLLLLLELPIQTGKVQNPGATLLMLGLCGGGVFALWRLHVRLLTQLDHARAALAAELALREKGFRAPSSPPPHASG